MTILIVAVIATAKFMNKMYPKPKPLLLPAPKKSKRKRHLTIVR